MLRQGFRPIGFHQTVGRASRSWRGVLHVGASVGIALYPAHGADGATLLRRADVAMYEAKRARGGYTLYSGEQDPHSPDRLTRITALREAIARGELLLHYQPKVGLRGGSSPGRGQVVGVEALVRWPRGGDGLVPPGEFIPLAEHTGLIAPLTRWVLAEALRQAGVWGRGGLEVGMQVNLSTWNLHDPALPDLVADLLGSHGVPPDRLHLEITESALMADAERAAGVLARLSALGVGVSVDDFGTGYSSLAYLKRLPVDEIKIDQSFVRNLAADETDAAIVASIIGLGRSLGLRVVAEGVEDRATWERLAALGCDAAQGYYLSRPLPAGELAAWLEGLDR